MFSFSLSYKGFGSSFRVLVVIKKSTNEFMETKRKYIAPHIDIIYLDNEISLQLESNPPIGPNESINYMNSQFGDNILRNQLS